jgi:hypothetical protein
MDASIPGSCSSVESLSPQIHQSLESEAATKFIQAVHCTNPTASVDVIKAIKRDSDGRSHVPSVTRGCIHTNTPDLMYL